MSPDSRRVVGLQDPGGVSQQVQDSGGNSRKTRVLRPLAQMLLGIELDMAVLNIDSTSRFVILANSEGTVPEKYSF